MTFLGIISPTEFVFIFLVHHLVLEAREINNCLVSLLILLHSFVILLWFYCDHWWVIVIHCCCCCSCCCCCVNQWYMIDWLTILFVISFDSIVWLHWLPDLIMWLGHMIFYCACYWQNRSCARSGKLCCACKRKTNPVSAWNLPGTSLEQDKKTRWSSLWPSLFASLVFSNMKLMARSGHCSLQAPVDGIITDIR